MTKQRLAALEDLFCTCIKDPRTVADILRQVDALVRAETASLEERIAMWVDLTMKGELLRERLLFDALLGRVGRMPGGS